VTAEVLYIGWQRDGPWPRFGENRGGCFRPHRAGAEIRGKAASGLVAGETGRDRLEPAVDFNPLGLSDIAGYDDQCALIISNTRDFVEGKPARNLLLSGPGAGKPAIIKAVCRKYAGRGLRLIEVSGGMLSRLPSIAEYLARRGLKFIIFIDEFPWGEAGVSFPRLGPLPSNTAVYAAGSRLPGKEQAFQAESLGFSVIPFPHNDR
jgi:hypothetical protein